MTDKKLYRNEDEAILAGVCIGLADYFDIDVTLMRVIFVLLFIGGGSGLLIYIILWIVTPKKNGETILESKENVKGLVSDLGKKTKTMAKEIKKEVKTSNRRGSLLGIVLIVAGILILLEKILPMEIRWDYVWPGVLIFVGGYLVFRD